MTGQMSAVETRQMSSAETRQMSTSKTRPYYRRFRYLVIIAVDSFSNPKGHVDGAELGQSPTQQFGYEAFF